MFIVLFLFLLYWIGCVRVIMFKKVCDRLGMVVCGIVMFWFMVVVWSVLCLSSFCLIVVVDMCGMVLVMSMVSLEKSWFLFVMG